MRVFFLGDGGDMGSFFFFLMITPHPPLTLPRRYSGDKRSFGEKGPDNGAERNGAEWNGGR